MISIRKLLPLLILCFILTVPAVNAISKTLSIFVEADIGVNVTVDCGESGGSDLNPEVGESGTCLVTINNTGNIGDKLELTAEVDPKEDRSWIDYHFECPGTIGECSLEYSYEETDYPPAVRNIQLDPDVSSTSVYLEATPYRSDKSTTLKIYGYSLTNRTVDEMATITVSGSPEEEGGYGPFAASGLSTASLILLFLLSGLAYSITEIR